MAFNTDIGLTKDMMYDKAGSVLVDDVRLII